MKAMVLDRNSSFTTHGGPLRLADVPVPEPGEGEVLIETYVCGVCHTELDEIEGRTPPSFYPIILGHQAVGRIVDTGHGVSKVKIGDRVGVAWIFSTCGKCEYCKTGKENLCDAFLATGRDVHGGYAEFMTAPEKYVHPIPEFFSNAAAAPLLCAGAIGFRSLSLTNLQNGQNLGLMGFGASAHLVLKLVRHKYPESKIFVFSRNLREQEFALDLGATWAGHIAAPPPGKLHAIIDTTPAWKPVVEALGNLEKGGRLVINAIRKEEKDKEELLQLSYPDHLWLEKEIKSVANVTAGDVRAFLHLAAEAGIEPVVTEFPLNEANAALRELKEGNTKGAKVLRIADS
ncbi:zinc-dependent alcohol dehydrogenase family protein [Salinimicrobium flavum]|uniref:alcohol dehydrogenase n=1 Tax=Salinimicrobium flavum TaxID=1737065 RepID=A0ABW5J0B7_9FLAO